MKKKQSWAAKAKRRYDNLVDYCENPYRSCRKCPYPKQCAELAEFGLSPGSGVKFDQKYPKDRETITQILGTTAKELSKR